uniref:Uncharacterized protein n=1 Tax=viral metagenome TaxID=1070528 RepID=A0A6H1ZBY6_9ZZZZ
MAKRKASRTPRKPVEAANDEGLPIVVDEPVVAEPAVELSPAVEESALDPIVLEERPRGRRITADTANDLPLQPFYSRQAVRAAPIRGPLLIDDDYYDEAFVGFVVYEAGGRIFAVPRDEFLAAYITASG